MNGVARDFWAEVYGLRTEPRDEQRDRPVRSKAKKVLVRRADRREAR
jgi:hypothetical protein